MNGWPGGSVEIVKHGPHRSVYRVKLGRREFYVKHFHCHTIWDRARHFVRPQPGSARMAESRDRRSARCEHDPPHCLAGAEGQGAGRRVVSGDRSDCRSLHARRILPAPPARVAAEATAGRSPSAACGICPSSWPRCIRTEICHDDLHPGNIIISLDGHRPVVEPGTPQYRLHLIDVTNVRFTRALTWPKVLASLAVLNAAWKDDLSKADRIRFWNAYAAARPELNTPHLHQVIHQLQQRTEAPLPAASATPRPAHLANQPRLRGPANTPRPCARFERTPP